MNIFPFGYWNKNVRKIGLGFKRKKLAKFKRKNIIVLNARRGFQNLN